MTGWLTTCCMLLLTGLPAFYSFAQTSTELTVETNDTGARTHATFTATVSGESTKDLTSTSAGYVTLSDSHGAISSAVIDSTGVATFQVNSLRKGENRVVASYSGSSGEVTSASPAVVVNALDSGVASFNFALSATALTVKAGSDGNLIATVSPTNGFTDLVSLSCAGDSVPLPNGVTCVFTPVNLVPTSSGADVTSSLSINTTSAAGKTSSAPLPQRDPNHPVLAVLLPGVIALAGLGLARKRGFRAQGFLSIAALLLITSLGLSSCSGRYHYLNHAPAANNGTPLGTYTIVITASSNSGSTVISNPLKIKLTVD